MSDMKQTTTQNNSTKQESSTPVESNESVEVNDQLRDVLMTFTATFLVEEPDDIIDYAVEFFKRLQTSRRNSNYVPIPMKNDTRSLIALRRGSVFAAPYDPLEEDGEETVIFPKTDEQRARLAKAVKNVLLFRALDCDQMGKVMDAMFERQVSKGEYIIRQGEDGDNFYVIDTGIFKVIKSGAHIHTYNNVGVFGELALMYNQPRAASILAETDGLLWALDRPSFRQIVLKSAYLKRKTYEDLINSVPMLRVLQDYERMTLADALVSKNFGPGEVIYKQGEYPDGMYFIEEGIVSVTITHAGPETEVARFERGTFFGEMSLVTKRARPVSVYAIGDVKLAFLDRDAFERILGFLGEILIGNAELYEKRWKYLLRLD